MCSQGCASRSRRVFSSYNLPHVLDLPVLAALAARMTTPVGSRTIGGRRLWPPPGDTPG
jgi:hypothetical protein